VNYIYIYIIIYKTVLACLEVPDVLKNIAKNFRIVGLMT